MREVQRYFEQRHFNDWKSLSDEELCSFFESERRFLTTNIRSGSVVLDIGCGSGDSLEPILENAKRVYGVDFAQRQLYSARQRLANRANITLVKADAEELPFNNSVFDYVTCMGNTLGNMENPERCLEEMIRILAPDGQIILGVYSKNALAMQLRTYEAHGVSVEFFNEDAVRIKEGLTSRRYSKEQLTVIAGRYGLRAEIIEPTQVSYIVMLTKNRKN